VLTLSFWPVTLAPVAGMYSWTASTGRNGLPVAASRRPSLCGAPASKATPATVGTPPEVPGFTTSFWKV
jgi:hypothetical protein